MADAGRNGRSHNRVFDLVGAYGPDLESLCRQGPALIAETAGIGVSAGPVPGRVPRTRFSSDPESARLEAAQLDYDEGPCRDAAVGGTIRADDLSDPKWRKRWPRFTPAALDAGVRAVCAVPLHAGGVHHDGALDLYRRTTGGWDATKLSAAATFAAAACELLTLERLDLDLTDTFTRARYGDSGLDPAADNPGLPLVRWFTGSTLSRVRAEVGAVAARHGLAGENNFRIVLAAHEAASNAVQHGGGHGQLLLWQRDGRLWCEISDHGPGIGAAALTAARTTAGPPAGQPLHSGLRLIHRACTSVQVTTDTTGTRLLLSHPLPAARP